MISNKCGDIQVGFIDRKSETLERKMVCKKQVVIIQGFDKTGAVIWS